MSYQDLPILVFTFIALYVQVYLFMVIIEEWDHIFVGTRNKKLIHFPKVVVAVPCWNEEKTVEKTVRSLLALDYPKDKLEIWIVDDGSTDNTWEIIKQFENNPQCIVRKKENGGKHSVLNYVLENSTCDIFGGLDADSFVFPDTLKKMLLPFADKEVMAVTPMMVVREPKNILQAIQSVEYNNGLFMKRIFSAINAIHVTPGPFSLFRREVFEKIGGYRHAHQTEDMEITFRMQKNHMKIVSATDAYVETSTPDTVYKLYRQRLRWSQGFLQNSLDYADIIFRPKYGNVAMLTIPLGWLGIVMVLYLAGTGLYHLWKSILNVYYNFSSLGLDTFSYSLNFDLQSFFTNVYYQMGTLEVIAIPLIITGIVYIAVGHALSINKSRKLSYIFFFILLWSLLTPFWFARAMFNTLTKRSGQWR